MDNFAINSANLSLNAAKDNETNSKDFKQRLEELFRSWRNKLQNLNRLNEIVTFLNELPTQTFEFDDKIKNRIQYFFNCNNVEFDEFEKESDRIIEESLSYNEGIHQIDLKYEEYRKRREQNYNEIEKLEEIRYELHEKWKQINQHAIQILENINRQERLQEQYQQQHGLSSEIIEKFSIFTADQSHVGDKCSICKEDFVTGKNMMRLDCDGRHAFCQVCIEGWFADHNTCPLCRHKFDRTIISHLVLEP